MPETTHTSPLHVESAADLPSLKKSNPPTRIQLFHGLSSGSVSVSTTYGPSPAPSLPLVTTVSGQRVGPPRVSNSGSGGSPSISTEPLPAVVISIEDGSVLGIKPVFAAPAVSARS